MLDIIAKIIAFIVRVIICPLFLAGYLSHFIWALSYAGWAKAGIHMEIIAARNEKPTTQGEV